MSGCARALAGAERRDFFASLTDGHLDQPVSYGLFNGTIDSQPLETLVRHITNHSTYHRGQIATFMRQLGHKPVSTDLIVFARERRG